MKRKAFTLIELVVSITIFVIFIAFVMSAYLTFNRSQQVVAATRSMLFEGEYIFNFIGDAMDENSIYFDYYNSDSFLGEKVDYFLETDELLLLSPDEKSLIQIYWEEDLKNENKGNLFYRLNDEEAIQLNDVGTSVDFISFEIFPDDNPYKIENQANVDFPHFQNFLRVNMSLSRFGGGEDVTLELESMFTSRFYQ